MKSAAYYRRKAANCRDLGRWASADDWKRLALKAARIERRRKEREDRAMQHNAGAMR